MIGPSNALSFAVSVVVSTAAVVVSAVVAAASVACRSFVYFVFAVALFACFYSF